MASTSTDSSREYQYQYGYPDSPDWTAQSTPVPVQAYPAPVVLAAPRGGGGGGGGGGGHSTSTSTSRAGSRFRRFYSSPLNERTESTPPQLYGLEQREPSILEKPRRMSRLAYALDDIKEDFPAHVHQFNPRATAEKVKRRASGLWLDSASLGSRPTTPGSTGSSTPGAGAGVGGRPRMLPRTLSRLSFDSESGPRRLGRRLSTRLGSFAARKKAPPHAASISSPNLIGSSTQV